MDKLYTVNETLKILRISRPTLYKLIKDGAIKPAMIYNRTLFKESEIERFIDHIGQEDKS